jgi:DNA-binding GntR family transcriptional regulator
MPQRKSRKNKLSHEIQAQPSTARGASLGEMAHELRVLYEQNAHRGTSVDIVYSTIRDAIRSRFIRSGTHLTELDLAAALHISRTPIREALQRLESEYLLEKTPRSGFVVPTLQLNDVVEIFEIREVLLGLATRCAAQRASPAEIALMAETIERMEHAKNSKDPGGLAQASAQFHRAIEQASRNRRLQKLIRLNSGAMPLYEFANPDRFAPVVTEHRAIYEAIAAHDAERAERLAQEHSRNAFQAQTRAHELAEAAIPEE